MNRQANPFHGLCPGRGSTRDFNAGAPCRATALHILAMLGAAAIVAEGTVESSQSRQMMMVNAVMYL
jgi:hypothetical protein